MREHLCRVAAVTAVVGSFAAASPAFAAQADCPNGGVVRFGVEPFEAAANLVPIFDKIGQMIAKDLGCEVKVFVATSYNAEIEAMRSGKLEIAEFGPLGYVLAHQVAKADAVATYSNMKGEPDTYTAGIVTWPGSGITSMADLAGKSFAYSDPDSTSGHLFPAFALKKAGIDPDNGIKTVYAGSHTASFEALRNHKVLAGELNSQEIVAATGAKEYDAKDFVEVWRSEPIPTDPIAVRADLPAGFKARLTKVLQNVDFSALSADERKHMMGTGTKTVPIDDKSFNVIRDLVTTLHIDLTKL